MPETNIGATVASNLAGVMKEFSVAPQTTDGPTGQKETIWIDKYFENYLGYYKDEKTPELTAVIDAKARWTVGKGFKADEITTMLLDSIKGFGKDTFNTILENAMRTMLIGGNFYAEIIRDEEDNLINLKPLDPASIQHVVDKAGMLTRFEQVTKIGVPNKKIGLDDIFYLARNRVADEIHGNGITQKLKLIIDMKNESMEDQRKLMHRHVKPLVKFILDTDDTSRIAAFKTTADKMIADGENLYLPKDTAEHEIISVPANATLNPMAWIQYLDNYFYEMAGVPKIIVGGSGEITEASAKISYLAFQQGVEEEQLFLEEQILSQLNLVIDLEFPASLENELLSDNKKDGAQNIDPSETTAGEGQ